MNQPQRLAIIGSGPSAIFLLKHLLDSIDTLRTRLASIAIFEQSSLTGMGMPYSPETTDLFHPSNISSEELPPLPETLGDWLRAQSPALLESLGIDSSVPISKSTAYPRLALGRYLKAQYTVLIKEISAAGIDVYEHDNCGIADISSPDVHQPITVITVEGRSHECDRLVIASGHSWPQEDRPSAGYFASPWPIFKLLPDAGTHYDFLIGTLGASLSAFDVISSLAHRHGVFTADASGDLSFQPHPDAEGFKIVMHSSRGMLPHLQFAQEQPIREIYRHIDSEGLAALLDDQGFLRIDTYFDRICRPTLIDAFEKDGMPDMARRLADPSFQFADFVKAMSADHDYSRPFEGMRLEMREARESLRRDQPIHWKEVIDDLMYTLNFHAHLLPAEDHLMLQSVVMPFLMNVIAAMPLASGAKLLALHDAGRLEVVEGEVKIPEQQPDASATVITVERDSQPSFCLTYRMFIDCSGQKPVELHDFPFRTLVDEGWVRAARAVFATPASTERLSSEQRQRLIWNRGVAHCAIGGIDVDSQYRLIHCDGAIHPRIHDIAFPHTSGLRPYSYGLQACNDTSAIVVRSWVAEAEAERKADHQ